MSHQLQKGARRGVDKKERKFNLKKMIERLHIKEPAEHVMAILGKRCGCVWMDFCVHFEGCVPFSQWPLSQTKDC